MHAAPTATWLAALPLLCAGCTADRAPDEAPFEVQGDYLLAYLEDHFSEGGSDRIYVTVDTAQQIAIGPAHWDDPDPHGTTTLPLEPAEIEALTEAIEAVDVPALSGASLGSGTAGADRYHLDLTVAQGGPYHVEWDADSDVPAALWDLQGMLSDMATWFLG
ncbi:MAG: hypothetical protein ABIO70_05050 [Pseudomonadota bacterium]